MKSILFMCVANSARSQVAEGLAQSILGDGVAVQSAGVLPGRVSPYAVKVLAEIGIDIRNHYSKSVESINLKEIDTVIVLCTEPVCPPLPPGVKKMEWPLPDPGFASGSEEAILMFFRALRDSLIKRINAELKK